MMNNSCMPADNVLFWALNCYPVTISVLMVNLSLALIGIITVLLNVIAASAIWQREQIENVSDLLIAGLAIADTVIGIFLIYQAAYGLGNWQRFHECLFRYCILIGSSLASVLHLSLLTVDRYVKITQPYLYQRIINRNAVIGSSLILWILAMALGFLPTMGWNNGVPSEEQPQCAFLHLLHREYTILLMAVFILPYFVNIILYCHIFRIVHRHAKSICDQQAATNIRTGPSRQTWKFTKTVGILMGFYFICWMPIGVFLLLNLCGYLQHISEEDRGLIVMYLTVPSYINSLANPVIYAIKLPYIKQRFLNICCCCVKKTSQVFESNTQQRHSVIPCELQKF